MVVNRVDELLDEVAREKGMDSGYTITSSFPRREKYTMTGKMKITHVNLALWMALFGIKRRDSL
jgi:hypothetical protein